jgi:competence protein ComEC
MEVFFLDVGQGTCQIILLGDQSAIVLDCGTRDSRLPLQFLKRYGVEYIPRLITTHSHADHMGGAANILGEFRERVDKICFVQDDHFLETAYWERISEFIKDETLDKSQLVRLERSDKPQVVWQERKLGITLKTYSPTAATNLIAQEDSAPNATSAVLFLNCGENRVIFASDSELEQWKEIHKAAKRKFECKVLAVAHHGGAMGATPDDLSWIFSEALVPEVAILSLGTNNQHGHPREDVIAALKSAGATIVCTQITEKCCPTLEPLRPGVLLPVVYPGRSSAKTDLTSGGNSRHVACAGTVRLEITKFEMIVDRLSDHQTAVNRMKRQHACEPLCRR